ncbi:hypothetical protein [Dactylosporangium sp. NPDC051541]|uniref:hypothetical protein n=1 Tax=Dactylosporangium sp. NPDC051541 TaxID=3363977 RepID=UPI00379927C4
MKKLPWWMVIRDPLRGIVPAIPVPEEPTFERLQCGPGEDAFTDPAAVIDLLAELVAKMCDRQARWRWMLLTQGAGLGFLGEASAPGADCARPNTSRAPAHLQNHDDRAGHPASAHGRATGVIWTAAREARADTSPRSPVRILDEMLPNEIVSQISPNGDQETTQGWSSESENQP